MIEPSRAGRNIRRQTQKSLDRMLAGIALQRTTASAEQIRTFEQMGCATWPVRRRCLGDQLFSGCYLESYLAQDSLDRWRHEFNTRYCNIIRKWWTH